MAANPKKPAGARIGLFGLLGSGNIGNDASMEALLDYLRREHPDALIDAMSSRTDTMQQRYGIPTILMQWCRRYSHLSGPRAFAARLFGKGLDIFRTANWVRRHDVIIIPGAGVLEASLPVGPWGGPFSMFLMTAAGRVFGTRTAMVSVGADYVSQPLTRRFYVMATRLAGYRSFRDSESRDAMRRQGVDVSRDQVYPDLAFALPAPAPFPGDPQIVCVGLMDFYGNNDDRGHAREIRASYLGEMTKFISWLLDEDRQVHLIIGDTMGHDSAAVQEVMATVLAARPQFNRSRLVAHSVATMADVMRVVEPAGSVVATRFHNVIAGLILAKPTIGIGYSSKHDALLASVGLAEFCEPARALDHEALIIKFKRLESSAPTIREQLIAHKSANDKLLQSQFARLTAELLVKPRTPDRAPLR
jgi:polysaccharide pyruvyl transferase WcaK-like protein